MGMPWLFQRGILMNRRLILAFLLSVILLSSAALPAPAQAAPAVTGITTAVVLNVRTTAYLYSHIVATAKYGTKVTILGRNVFGTWLEIQYPGVVGWVSWRFIRFDNPAQLIHALPVVH